MRASPVVLWVLVMILPAAGEAIATGTNKPTLAVALGMTPEQVAQRAGFTVPWQLSPIGNRGDRGGGAFIKTPHRLVYEDPTLRLVLPDAGNQMSMPTGLMVHQDKVNLVTASVLGDYVRLGEAVAASRKLLGEVEAQGFAYGAENPQTWQFAKFYLAKKNTAATPRPPDTVASFEEMEKAFLNSTYYVEEVLVFRVEKDDLAVRLRVTNMRRRFTESQMPMATKVQRELRELGEESLRKERAYYLEVSFSRR